MYVRSYSREALWLGFTMQTMGVAFEFQVKSEYVSLGPNQLPFLHQTLTPRHLPWGAPGGGGQGFCLKSHFLFGAKHFLQVTHKLPLAPSWEAKVGIEMGPGRIPPCLVPRLGDPETEQCHRLDVRAGPWKEDARLFSPSLAGRALRVQGNWGHSGHEGSVHIQPLPHTSGFQGSCCPGGGRQQSWVPLRGNL